MKRLSWPKVGVVVLFSLVIVSISFAGGHKSKPSIPEVWTKIMPDPDFEYNGLTPGCSGCPTCSSDEFYFFAKGGKGKNADNLIIFFQGGGACWHSNNCIYPDLYTYNPQITEEVEDLEAFEGIFDMDNRKNPFKKWSFVFIPYCTGDIHWGAYDMAYSDHFGAYGGKPVTIKHRGFVNFQAVLEWIAQNFKRPRKIFVTGSSAGSYGALNAFPYIKETFPRSKAYLLGDAGNGVLEEDFQDDYVNNWDPQFPEWIFDPEEWSFDDSGIAEMYTMIAESYPRSKIAQYTTAWDGTQAFFYNVMLNIENPNAWENFFPVWSDWHEQMLEYAYFTADASSNYRYYIAAGTDHTILRDEKFYEEKSAGIPFEKWVKEMVKKPLRARKHWKNLECEDCEDPFSSP